MRSIILFLFAATFLTACATNQSPVVDTSPWNSFGYKGMAEKINRLAGEGSINCGIRNHLQPKDPVNQQISPQVSRECVKAAIESKIPFRYGSIRVPIDSQLFDALVLSDSGEFWLIRYDVMFDGGEAQHFIERCKSASVEYSSMTYKGIDCQDVSAREWLADIPENQSLIRQ